MYEQLVRFMMRSLSGIITTRQQAEALIATAAILLILISAVQIFKKPYVPPKSRGIQTHSVQFLRTQ